MFRPRVGYSIVILLVFAVSLHAAEKKYGPAKFIEVQRKTREKVEMYLVNSPMTSEVPYFEASIELGDSRYVAEYTPRHADEELPDNWHGGEEVKARVDKHHLFLVRPEGGEMQWLITKRKPISTEKPQQ